MYQLNLFDAPLIGESSLHIRIRNPIQAAKLRELAESMQNAIDAKKYPAIAQQRPTRRRTLIAEGMYFEAKQMEEIQSWLQAIALGAETGDLPEILNGISSKSQLEILRKISSSSWDEEDIKKFESSEGRYANWKSALKKANIHNWMQAQKAITALKELYSPPIEDPIKIQIRRLESKLVGMKMHDFFPTPSSLCERLVKLAKLNPGMKVLEPSAGKGDVSQTILRYHPDVHLDVIEIQENLRKILELKGFNVIGYNFLNYTSKKWDAVIANPPFSEFIEHTYHAYKCLVSGGTLVTIAPESVFNRSERKFFEFRQWMTSHHAKDEKLPDGSFLDSINPTGVSTRILVIKKL